MSTKYQFGRRIKTVSPKKFKIFLRGMSVHQKLGIILESKVLQKLSLERNVFNKKWSHRFIFLRT